MRRWKLHIGDALPWLETLPSDSVDAVITDPPYSSGGRSTSERKQTTRSKYIKDTTRDYPDFPGDGRDQRSWVKWMVFWLVQTWRIARPGSPICVFSDWRQLPCTSDALQMAGWIWRGTLVWDKTGAARPVRGRFRQQSEFIVWGSKGKLASDRRCQADSNVLPGVYRHRVNPRDKHHLTGKPTPLMRDLLCICEPGGLVLDPFTRSGTTGIAALDLGLRFLGCELSPDYGALAKQRLKEHVTSSTKLQTAAA